PVKASTPAHSATTVTREPRVSPDIHSRRRVRMKPHYTGARLWGLFGCLLLCLCAVPSAWAQQTLGTVSVTVVDTSGAVIPGAQLELTDLATNDVRTATAQQAGNYTFVNLNFGQYKLTVSLQG